MLPIALMRLKGSIIFVEFLASFWKNLGACQLFHEMIVVTLRVSVQTKEPVSD